MDRNCVAPVKVSYIDKKKDDKYKNTGGGGGGG